MSHVLYKQYDPLVLKKLQGVQTQMLKDVLDVCEKYDLPCFLIYGTAIGAVRHKGFIPWDDDIDVGMLRKDYDRFLEVFDQELRDHYEVLTPETDSRYACTVTHIQRKNTVFITEMTKNLKCNCRIFMDIFPFDNVPNSTKEQNRLLKKSTLYGKLLFLSGSGSPHIPYSGILYHVMHLGCMLIHGLLKLFHITPPFLYRRFKKVSTAFNDKDYEYVTSYEYTGCIKDKIKKSDILPLKKVPFENIYAYIPANNDAFLKKVYGDYMQIPPEEERVNHAPLVIQFEGEDPIYGE